MCCLVSDIITLVVNGTKYAYWKSANIQVGIEQIAGQFALSYADRWSGQQQALPFSEGDECKVYAGDNLVIAGYIDDLETSFSAIDTTDNLIGRDYTGDLVDCSVVNEPDEWKNINLFDLAKKLCSPFGIRVVQDTDVGEKFLTYKIQQGETVFEALSRAAKMRGILLVSAKDKGLRLTTRGSEKINTPLVAGKNGNILSCRKLSSYADRYSQYTVKGQQGGIELDGYSGDEKSVIGQAKDKIISRYRPLLVLAENQADAKSARRRAEWEASTRAAKSLSLSVVVQGWTNSSGQLWEPNFLVDVEIPRASIKAEMLIVSCNYSMDVTAGSITNIGLRDKRSYTLRSEIKSDYKLDSTRGLGL